MDEGKPTKAKWWSRPRPSAPDDIPPGGGPAESSGTAGSGDRPGAGSGDGPGAAQDSPAGVDIADGARDPGAMTAEGAAPGGMHGGSAGSPGPGGVDGTGQGADGPSSAVPGGTAPAASGARPRAAADGPREAVVYPQASEDGDYLVAPASAPQDSAGQAPRPAGGDTRPAAVGAAHVQAVAAPARYEGQEGFPQGEGESPAAVMGPAPIEDSTGPADAAPAAATSPPVQRPRPLHDPDPYSTPPYGEPGPWAPAPPVQHPGTTPARGNQILPPAPRVPDGTRADGTPVPAATPAHGTTLPVGTPAHGVPMPGAPVAGMPQSYGTSPAEASASHHTGDPQFAPPAAAAPQPPHPANAQHTTPYATAGALPPPHTGVPAAGPEAGAVAVPAFPPGSMSGRWHVYDPWAAAPLQQNGSLPAESRRRGRAGARFGVVLVALLAGLLGGAIGSYLERSDSERTDVSLPQAGPESPHRAPDSVAGIAASALPSVVTIHVRGDEEQGTGTGFVLDGRGHILTNNHVVRPAGTSGDISVTFSGGQTAKAKVIGRDSGYDLAVIKVSGVTGLKPLPLGNSDNVQVGDPVVAIGAPFDLANTVTAGIISAKERPITTAGGENSDGSDVSYVDALQTDAPINPGNSGGPLVDAKARVIGINSAIRSADNGQDPGGGQAGSIGLGFAIPINQAKRVAEELINTGTARHPVIGVTLDMDYGGDGARVADQGTDGAPAVNKDGPADRAGIRAGDIITTVDGQQVHSGEELIVKIRAHRPGDKLELTLKRGGRSGSDRNVTLVLGAAQGN